jgi:hypothetical protein
LEAAEELDCNAWTEDFARSLQRRLATAGATVAHLKMTLAPLTGPGDLALVNLVDQDLMPELSQHLGAPVRQGQLVVTLRAEAKPEILSSALEQEVDSRSELCLEHLERFAPGQPQPTHRMTTA